MTKETKKQQEFFFPSYDGEGLINLIASIENSLGGKARYPELNLLKSNEIKSKNVVLIILDGMGYEFFKKHLSKSSLAPYLKGKITSVLSAGTSSAMTTILTGQSPKETGMVGWDVFLRELGVISDAIPYTAKFSKQSLENSLDINKIYNFSPLTNRIKTSSYQIFPQEISKNIFNKNLSGSAKILPYNNIKKMFNLILKKLKERENKFILAYSYNPDKILHSEWESEKLKKEMSKLDKYFKKFIQKVSNTNSTIIITADHGLRKALKKLDPKEEPKLDNCLRMPFCGEGGLAYCYVKKEKEKEFENVIKKYFKNYCDIFKSKEFVKKGYFGKFKEHPEFLNRIGDYILVFKKGYANGSKLDCFEKSNKLGFHGGLTKEEMFVPLIVIQNKKVK